MSNSLDTSSCLLSLTVLISNIIRIHFGISCGNADGIFVGEKCEHFFRLNVCIGFRVSSTFGQSDGCMSDTPETMGGLSGVPNGTSSQTSASRGYVLFRGANKGHTRRSYKLSPGCGHDPRSVPNLERHGSSKMQTSSWLEMPHFLNRISSCIFI